MSGQPFRSVGGDLVRVIYDLMPVGMLATAFNAVVIAVVHWQLVPGALVVGWLVSLLALTLARAVTLIAFRRAHDGEPGLWRRRFVVGITASGVLWGASASFGLLHPSLSHQVLVAFALGGMVAGAAATFSAVPAAFHGYAVPALLPQIVVFAIQGGAVRLGMATMLLLFYGLMSLTAVKNRALILSRFVLHHEREDMVASLTHQRDSLEAHAARLAEEVRRRQELETELRAAQSELENKVEVRTAELAASNQRLSVSNAELAAFTHTVSHDLRGPLQAIDGFARLLAAHCGGVLGQAGQGYLGRVLANSLRMSELIEDLLTLSDVAYSELRRTHVDLSAMAREVIEGFTAREPKRAVEVVIQPDCAVEGDPRLLRVVLENLLANAWKFTRTTSPGRIELGLRAQRGVPACWVSDNGVGFDMSRAGELFRPFHRLHDSAIFPGSGVGLATVARIIARHSGAVGAESAPGKGATFWFTCGPLPESREGLREGLGGP
jgi:signal transduction histidine kinase